MEKTEAENLISLDNTLDSKTAFASGEVIVKLREKADVSSLNSLQASLGAITVKTTKTRLGIELWSIPGNVEDFIHQNQDNPLIEYIEPNYIITVASTVPNDPSFSQLWGLDNIGQTGGTFDADIDAPEAWDIQTGSNNVVVGVIDSGIDYTHPDLVDNMWTNPGEIPGNGIDDDGNGYVDDVYGYDFVNNDGDPFDDHSHGTHVAGTIGADGDNGQGIVGVNWNVDLMAVKWLDDNNRGYVSDAILAVEYATMMGADLTNNSWSLDSGFFSQGLYDTIEQAGIAGSLFIAAVGNDDGNNNDTDPVYPASYDLDNIISVASTNHNDNLSSFSNIGATSVDLGAPGSSIYSTVIGGGYDYKSGTSMATPHVSGVAALILAENPDLSYQEVKEIILDSTDPISELDGKTLTGGRLNAFNALSQLAEPEPPGNASPTDITLSQDTINENVPANSVVGTLITTDPDTGDTFTYELVSGVGDDDNAAFTIDGDQLKINSSPDYETQSSYNIRVESTDAAGETYEEELTINVNDLNEEEARFDFNADGVADILWRRENGENALWLMNDDGTLNQGIDMLPLGTSWDVAGVDDFNADGIADILWRRENGENALWLMNDDGTLNQGIDMLPLGTSWDVAGKINDVNKNSAPTDISLSNNSINENIAANTVVGTLSTTDPDTDDTFTYELVVGVGDDDNAAFTIDGDRLKINSSPDYETQSNYNIRVQSTDAAGETYEEELTINVKEFKEEEARFDFNADGVADILWRRQNGENAIWLMNDDGTLNQGIDIIAVDTDWDVAGVDDFNADGIADILWRRENGDNALWLMNDDGTLNQGIDIIGVDTDWDVAGVDDFNADGIADILWRRENGENAIWLMNDDGTLNQGIDIIGVDTDWDVAGVDDFNADGIADILWRRENGENAIWLMNDDGTLDQGIDIIGVDTDWDVAGVDDFNADGIADILWRRENGENAIWLMNDDGTLNQGIDIIGVDTDWDVAGVDDFNADGIADILWRRENGENAIWLMNDDGTLNQGIDIIGVDTAWDVAGM